jgi:hypothetical protein
VYSLVGSSEFLSYNIALVFSYSFSSHGETSDYKKKLLLEQRRIKQNQLEGIERYSGHQLQQIQGQEDKLSRVMT